MHHTNPHTFIRFHLINYRQAVADCIDTLLEKGIIRRSTSEFRAPCVPVPKPDGSVRFCVDFRALNKVTKPDNYQLPRIDHIKTSINGKIFSAIDLKDGFYQIPIDKKTIPLTAVAVGTGTYEYLRMPFGLRNAPPVFQRFMDSVCHKLRNTLVYIDDVIVWADTVQEHMEYIRSFLERASEYGLTINWRKSHFFQLEIRYLGFDFDRNGCKPKKEVKPKIMDFPVPHDKRSVLKFMGIVNYYRNHIMALAQAAMPLYDLQKAYVRFK